MKTVKVFSVDDLPIPQDRKPFKLRNWGMVAVYRATAFSYLRRQDGAKQLTYNGVKYVSGVKD